MHLLALGLGKFMWEIERGMPSSEFAKWQKFHRTHPWGAARDNMHAALIVSNLWKTMCGRDVSMANFMLRPAEPEKPISPEERHARIASALRSVSKRKGAK